jgi:hypothetical protein
VEATIRGKCQLAR